MKNVEFSDQFYNIPHKLFYGDEIPVFHKLTWRKHPQLIKLLEKNPLIPIYD